MSDRTQACQICGYDRQFIEMGEKLGKDGRIARWPIFDDCPRKDNPEYHPASAPTEYLMVDKDAPVMEVEMRILAIGWIWSCYPENPMDALAAGLEEYERRNDGKLPTSIAVHAEMAEGTTEIEWETLGGYTTEIPIRTDLLVQPHDIYFIMEG